MKTRILIIEPDNDFATRLAATLEKGEYQATIVRNVRDACLILVQQPQHLAFVPAHCDDGLLRALLFLQPELPLVGIVPAPPSQLTQSQRTRLKTVISKTRYTVELPLVLEAILQKPIPSLFLEDKPENKASYLPTTSAVDIGHVVALLQQFTTDTGIAAIFTQGASVLAYSGDITNEQAITLSHQAHQTWTHGTLSAQVQFYRLPGRVGELLLYSRPITEPYFLLLAALPTTSLGHLRQQVDQLRPRLQELIGVETSIAAALSPLPTLPPKSGNNHHTYAILWRTRETLPDFLHIPLRRALERIAKANACVLTHYELSHDHVQIVVTCPPGRNSTWAAHLFKNGSEKEIQIQFQVRSTFWLPGYYATESADPLPAVERDLFLQHSQTP